MIKNLKPLPGKKVQNVHNEPIYKGSTFFFTSNLYEACLKVLSLCFEDNDICQLIIDSNSSDKLANITENLYSMKCQRYIFGEIEDFDYFEYMPVKDFKNFLLNENVLFKLLLKELNIEIKIFKDPSGTNDFFERKKSEHISIIMSSMPNIAIVFENGKLKSASCYNLYNGISSVFNPDTIIENCQFYIGKMDGVINRIAIQQVKIGKSNNFDIQNIIKTTGEMMVHDTAIYPKYTETS